MQVFRQIYEKHEYYILSVICMQNQIEEMLQKDEVYLIKM